MKSFYLLIFTFFSFVLNAQQEFHVFPKNNKKAPGTASGNGSLHKPWDLQTALSQKVKVVNGGDIIWLHKGVYTGRFTSNIKSTVKDKFVTVSSFKNDQVILNGNIKSKGQAVLTVKGNNVIFKDFEITCLGNYSRNSSEPNFLKTTGIMNTVGGYDCKFINLVIHGNPGGGIGSWRQTGGTLISNCLIFDNGYVDKNGKAYGEGLYVQNNSNKERVIKDNIIFNNYYKGVEVWSANRRTKKQYVKNITLDNNVVFNSGLPSGDRTVDNIIVASDDRNGINIAHNITIKNNILYHNTDFKKNQVNGDAASLTIGFHKNAPVENVIVDSNIIIGRNNALRILYAKSLIFTNNKVYSGYVHFNKSLNTQLWNFDSNTYFTKKTGAFRVIGDRNYPLKDWKSKFKMDTNSKWGHSKSFDLDKVLDITKNEFKPNRYRVVLFSKNESDVIVDFSKYKLKEGLQYTIKDVENYKQVLKNGTLNETFQVVFPMTPKNITPHKTLNNFGVFIIEFEEAKVEEKKRKGFFGRLFDKIF